MVMVSVALVMSVITTNLYAKKDSAQEAPRCIVRIAKKMYPEVLVPPEEKPHSHHSQGYKQNCNSRHSDIMSMADGEMDSLTCGCCCQCHNKPDFNNQLDIDRIEAEWKLVSKMVDRCFFWIFMLLSIAVQSVLFMNMVPKGPHPDTLNDNDEGG